MHMNKLNLKGLKFPMEIKDIPKFEKPNNLNIRVFELTNNLSTPIYNNTKYTQPQID